jgi:hypothetical protein
MNTLEDFMKWMRSQRGVFGLLLLFGWVQFAAAHPDSERAIEHFTGSNGTTYSIILHRTDGIVAGDPVRVEIRNSTGQTVAKTPYLRDVVLTHDPEGKARAHAIGSDHSFWRSWTIVDGSLVEDPVTVRGVVSAFLAHLTPNWLGYAFSVSLCVAGLALWFHRLRKKTDCRVPVPLLFWWALIWLILVWMYGGQSLLIVLSATLIASLPMALWTLKGGRSGEAWRSGPPS